MRPEPFAAMLFLVLLVSSTGGDAGPKPSPEVVRVWPGQAPGSETWTAPEEAADVTIPNVGKIHVITNVSVPTLTVFRPATAKANGSAMVILPGGSFRALAWDVDGVDTARWLASKGITAFVLKYRVRPLQSGESFGETLEDFARATRARRALAVADAEQSIRLIRSRSRQFSIDPKRVGIIGFSAGAMTAVDVALIKDPPVRPDFAVLMYGATLSDEGSISSAPPVFIAAAQDDRELPASKSLEIFTKWTKAGSPAELHIYEHGGHGFGFRSHQSTSDTWPASLEAWLAARGYLRDPTTGSGSAHFAPIADARRQNQPRVDGRSARPLGRRHGRQSIRHAARPPLARPTEPVFR